MTIIKTLIVINTTTLSIFTSIIIMRMRNMIKMVRMRMQKIWIRRMKNSMRSKMIMMMKIARFHTIHTSILLIYKNMKKCHPEITEHTKTSE